MQRIRCLLSRILSLICTQLSRVQCCLRGCMASTKGTKLCSKIVCALLHLSEALSSVLTFLASIIASMSCFTLNACKS